MTRLLTEDEVRRLALKEVSHGCCSMLLAEKRAGRGRVRVARSAAENPAGLVNPALPSSGPISGSRCGSDAEHASVPFPPRPTRRDINLPLGDRLYTRLYTPTGPFWSSGGMR